VSLHEVRDFTGHGARALITRGLMATGGLPTDFDLEPHYRNFVAYYADNIAIDSTVFPGLLALLDRLRDEGVALGVCTNKLEWLSVRLLDGLGMMKYFGSVVGPDTVGVSKPDPRPFYESVRRLGPGKPRAIMVGDSETDILTARAAGVPVIGVTFGYTPKPVAEFGPDRVIAHYDECWDAIHELFASS
jgi:phosphoglycolate phosphatase